MDLTSRREPLRTLPSPDSRIDIVTSLNGSIDWKSDADPVRVLIRYVPDRDVLEPSGFEEYLSNLGSIDWPTLEAAGAAILDDVNNQVVPRFVLVSVEIGFTDDETAAHSVLLEDNQPGWNNASLLSRLKTL
jgi:7-cyano-7-deazaguanine reductase